MNKILQNTKYFFFIVISLSLTILFDLPNNIHNLINFNYESRMMKIYGYCYPQGYGFIKDIKQKYKLKNVRTINFDDFSNSDFFLNNPKENQTREYLILINYKLKNKKDYSLNKEKIIFKKDNCILIKND